MILALLVLGLMDSLQLKGQVVANLTPVWRSGGFLLFL